MTRGKGAHGNQRPRVAWCTALVVLYSKVIRGEVLGWVLIGFECLMRLVYRHGCRRPCLGLHITLALPANVLYPDT